jgi:hypothetical protein
MATSTPTNTPTASPRHVNATPTSTATATPTPGSTWPVRASSFFGDESQDEPVTIDRTGDLSGTTTVFFTTTDGTAHGGAAGNGTGCGVAGVDYILLTNVPVTFNPGENTKTVFITLCGDTIIEPTETINLH